MSIPNLSDLLASLSQSQWMALALAQLQGTGFPTTDWTSTSPERAMLETQAASLADQDTQIPAIVALELIYYAAAGVPAADPSPPSLQFLAFNWYQLTYFPATPTVGDIRLACNSLAGPYTIAAGQLIATDGAGHFYANRTGGTLNTSDFLTVDWQCQTAGVAGNVANDTIVTLVTPLPGVTVLNGGTDFSPVTAIHGGSGTVTPSGNVTDSSWVVEITTTGGRGVGVFRVSEDGGANWYASNISIPGGGAYGPDGEGLELLFDVGTFLDGDTFSFLSPGSWITTQGTDVESTGSLVTRCLARWPSLAEVPNVDVYTKWALESVPGQITRVKVVTDPTVAATVNVYIAGPSAVSTAADQNQCQTYIDARAPLTDLPDVIIAGATAVTIAGAATYPVAGTSIVADRTAAINAYVNSLIPGSTIERAWIGALAMNLSPDGIPTGATNITGITLNGVAADLVLSSTNIATVTNSIAWTPA